MKIVDMKVRTVAIPTTCQLRHNTGVHPGYFIRNVLELITDEGIVGLGEVGGGAPTDSTPSSSPDPQHAARALFSPLPTPPFSAPSTGPSAPSAEDLPLPAPPRPP